MSTKVQCFRYRIKEILRIVSCIEVMFKTRAARFLNGFRNETSEQFIENSKRVLHIKTFVKQGFILFYHYEL